MKKANPYPKNSNYHRLFNFIVSRGVVSKKQAIRFAVQELKMQPRAAEATVITILSPRRETMVGDTCRGNVVVDTCRWNIDASGSLYYAVKIPVAGKPFAIQFRGAPVNHSCKGTMSSRVRRIRALMAVQRRHLANAKDATNEANRLRIMANSLSAKAQSLRGKAVQKARQARDIIHTL